MASGDFNDLFSKLNVRLGDSDNFTFTPEEKEEALTEAFNDDYVTIPKWDTSLTFDSDTYQYTLPTGVDTVQEVGIKPDNSYDEPQTIDSNLWEVVGSNLQFRHGSKIIPDGYTLYIKGKTKLDVADTLSTTKLQEYVLNLAQLYCLDMLGTKKALRFLKNDTSMSEVIGWKREIERKITKYRQRQPVSYEGS